jgi:ATP-dependent DNA helicase RecG
VSIESIDVSPRQRDLILGLQEGHFGDLKAIEISPAKLTESISALANADGGELYVGIDEDKHAGIREWRGFDDQEHANAHLQVCERLFPLGRDFEYTFLRCIGEKGLVLQMQIQKTRDIKRSSDGSIFVRRGAQNLRVSTPDAHRQLEYTKGLASFETEIVDVDAIAVTNSYKITEFMLDVIPTAEAEPWLRKQQLIRDDRPTVASILLFADEPQALIPKRSGIKVYRYTTKDRVGSRETLAFDPLTVEGPLYDQIRAAVDTTIRVVQDARILGSEGLEAVTYPPEAVHEIITNAVLHRDYSVADDVHIRIFDNRVEIESPGRLPAHITVHNILDERFARNGALVRLLNKFPDPPNKDVGEGLNTAFAAMTKLGLKEPVIQENANSVMVTIRHEPLASPEEIILEYLETHDTIRNKIAREITHVPADYVIKETFNRLVARELIRRVAGTRTASTAYEKGAKYDSWRRAHQPKLSDESSGK